MNVLCDWAILDRDWIPSWYDVGMGNVEARITRLQCFTLSHQAFKIRLESNPGVSRVNTEAQ